MCVLLLCSGRDELGTGINVSSILPSLVEAFTIAPDMPKDGAAGGAAMKKPGRVQLLDGQLSQNMAISLTAVKKLGWKSVVAALIAMDTDALGGPLVVQSLCNMQCYKSEVTDPVALYTGVCVVCVAGWLATPPPTHTHTHTVPPRPQATRRP